MTLPGAPQRMTLAHLLEDIRRLPSSLTQLAYLANMRDPNTAIYSHQAIRERELRRQADRELRRLHEFVFRHWLNMRLEDQSADFDLHISGIPCDKATVVRTWMSCETYRAFIPASATQAERCLFLGNLEVLLDPAAERTEETSKGLSLLANGGKWLSVRQFSEYIGVPTRTVRLWAEQGEIPAVKIGRQWRFKRGDIDKWLETLGRRKNREECRQQRQ
jgi:excisionase family DNA binding protein